MKLSTDIFILTGEWQDINGRHYLRYYGVSKEYGSVEIIINNQKPLFFIPRTARLPAWIQPSERRAVSLCNFAGEEVDALYFPTQKALRDAVQILKDANIPTFEADVKPERRFLMERFINAQATVQGKAVQQGRRLVFTNPRMTPCEITPEFTVLSLDIETGVESDRLYSIAAYIESPSPLPNQEKSRVFMLEEAPPLFPEYLSFYPSERELLQAFLKWFGEVDPDIIIGWNVIGFDLVFLERKCHDSGIPFTLSRSNRPVSLRKKERWGHVADVSGRVVIDGPQALRGAFFTFDDYRLETVARDLIDSGKAIDSEEDKIEQIERMFREDKAALARYNLQDCVLVSEIFRKTGLLKLFVRRSQISGMLLSQVGMSVAAFDHYFLPRLHRKGIVAPNAEDITGMEHAAGGYVMEPEPGIFDHVIVLDFKSLYPSIIQSFKIDPFSRLKADINSLQTPKGLRFSATEHILPELIDRLMEQRARAKREGDRYLSQAIKILMNSFYGVMGAFGCRFYHPDLPTAITGTGQWLLLGCKEFLEQAGYRVLYGDTDSVFIQLKPEEARQAAATGIELAERLNRHWQTELQKMGVTSYLEMEFEKYYRKFVLPLARAVSGGARKRYAGLAVNGEKETLEFVGMEYVRSDWTPLAKEFQYELYRRLLTGVEVRDWIIGLIKKILNGELDDKLIYRKRLRKDAHEYNKNIAPQVRAALMMKKPSREVRYLVTRKGPVPIELSPQNIDYQHYIEKQLKPIADSILGLLGTSFEALIYPEQLELF